LICTGPALIDTTLTTAPNGGDARGQNDVAPLGIETAISIRSV
jgi:hypothetical protein